MALTGRLHPLLVHFPIALVIAAALAEIVALATDLDSWHGLGVANVRVGAAFAVAAAFAGWVFALSPGVDASATLEWHRWLGTVTALGATAAALASGGVSRRSRAVWGYRIALFLTAACVAITGHLGGVLVWGENFLRP